MRPSAVALFLVISASGDWPMAEEITEPVKPVVQQKATDDQQRAKAPDAPVVVPNAGTQKDAEKEKSPNEHPTEYEKKDLLLQGRMAQAAEDAVQVAKSQTTAVWIQIGLVIFTALISTVAVFISAKAMKIAAQANTATIESDERGYKSFIVENRAWIVVDANLLKPYPDGSIGFAAGWKNVGVTPAVNVRIFSAAKAVPPDAEVPVFSEQRLTGATVVIGPGGTLSGMEMPMDTNSVRIMARKERRAFLYVRAEYNDVFTDELRQTSQTFEIFVNVNEDQLGQGVNIAQVIDTRPVGNQNRVE
jgi:hypothetical protein